MSRIKPSWYIRTSDQLMWKVSNISLHRIINYIDLRSATIEHRPQDWIYIYNFNNCWHRHHMVRKAIVVRCGCMRVRLRWTLSLVTHNSNFRISSYLILNNADMKINSGLTKIIYEWNSIQLKLFFCFIVFIMFYYVKVSTYIWQMTVYKFWLNQITFIIIILSIRILIIEMKMWFFFCLRLATIIILFSVAVCRHPKFSNCF